MTIGLLSDTHGFLEPVIFTHFQNCDEIWHAGDIGDLSIADKLGAFKPLRAVHGNIDDLSVRTRFPEDLIMIAGGVRVLMTHIGGVPPNYNPRVRRMLHEHRPQVFICGHSHILKIGKDPASDILYVNPGAAGNQGFHIIKTLVRFTLSDGVIGNMEVIEIGKRGFPGPGRPSNY